MNFNDHESVHVVNIIKLTLKCRKCSKEFFFNNKFHKHFKTCNHFETKMSRQMRQNQKSTTIHVITLIPIIKSINKAENHCDFVFRVHRYAIAKKSLILKRLKHNFCLDSDTFMSLMNRTFLTKQFFHIIKHETSLNIKIKKIKIKIHDNSKYVLLNFFFEEKCRGNAAITYVKTEFHLINDFKIKMLIKINVLKFEKIILNFQNKSIIMTTCQSMKISIAFHRKGFSVNRTIKAATQIVVSIEKIVIISIQMKSEIISTNKNYCFYFQSIKMLKSENEYFVHVTKSKLIIIQMKNISKKSYTMFKNFKIDHLRDYDEKKIFLTHLKDCHFAVASSKIVNVKKALKRKKETIFQNGIKIYENERTISKIKIIIEKKSQIWCSISKMINFSSEKWMKMKIIKKIFKFFRVFRVLSKDRIFIDKKFDALHQQKKLKWIIKFISYVFSIFVIWHTVHRQNKKSLRKDRMIVNIKNLNKISNFDAYFMSLQSDIISCLQDCKFIFVINCVVFFYQRRVFMKDRHKLIVITHKGVEQWNVTMMNWKSSPAYVQRKINDIFRDFSFARVYINNVVIFNNILNEHLTHLKQIFELFENWNITFKAIKIYFEYFSIFLLNQKVDNFELSIATNKLKVINELEFSKNLKTLKKYFDMIEYFKNYMSYYAQKSKPLNKQKTELLRNGFIKKAVKQNFNKKTLFEHATKKNKIISSTAEEFQQN